MCSIRVIYNTTIRIYDLKFVSVGSKVFLVKQMFVECCTSYYRESILFNRINSWLKLLQIFSFLRKRVLQLQKIKRLTTFWAQTTVCKQYFTLINFWKVINFISNLVILCSISSLIIIAHTLIRINWCVKIASNIKRFKHLHEKICQSEWCMKLLS